MLLVLVVLLSTACSTGSGSSGGDLDSNTEGQPEGNEAAGFVGQTFDFSMAAVLGDIVDGFQDSMDSDWTGTFTINENGAIQGSGRASYEAAILNTDDGCGYVWFEGADFDFTISGQAQLQGETMALSLQVEPASDFSPQRTEPAATCDDPGEWRLDTPEIYFDLHRDFMLSDTQLGLSRLAPRILIGQPLEAEAGGVDFTILVDLAAVPLSD
jgi:hypothetical protein